MQDNIRTRLALLLIVAASVAIIYTPTFPRTSSSTTPSLFIVSGILSLVFLFMVANIYYIYSADDIDIESSG